MVRGDDVLRHRILGKPGVFVAFTTYCVGNLIGPALSKLLTVDWKCKVSVFW